MACKHIYTHGTLDAFLNDPQTFTRGRGAASFGRLAKKLGYNSPRGIAMVLNGQRLPSAVMTRRIAEHLTLDERERCYLDVLVEKARLTRKQVDSKHLDRDLEGLRPTLDRSGRELT